VQICYHARMKKVITHSGGFHADDVFAVATLQLLLGKEQVEVVRTRDSEVIAQGDYVVDVGGVFDAAQHRFDHHQPGAPVRDNGIPYAAFGLVWREYGEEICGSKEVFETIEEKLCQPIDAGDSGVALCALNEYRVAPYEIGQVIASFRPVWSSNDIKATDMDVAFLAAVEFARNFLERYIKKQDAKSEMRAVVQAGYDNSTNKNLIIYDVGIAPEELIQYAEAEVVVMPDQNGNWIAVAVRVEKDSFTSRVYFPDSWAGKRDEELAEVSGLHDAVFCHKNKFLFVAKSKESAIRAAEFAV